MSSADYVEEKLSAPCSLISVRPSGMMCFENENRQIKLLPNLASGLVSP